VNSAIHYNVSISAGTSSAITIICLWAVHKVCHVTEGDMGSRECDGL